MSSMAPVLNRTRVIISESNLGLQVSAPACLLVHFGFAKVSVNLALMASEMRLAHIIALAASF